jgi:hypothetical protein
MPRILVTTELTDKPEEGVMLDEHVATSDLASNHFATQLIERIGWAVIDAESTEHQPIEQRRRATGGVLPDILRSRELEAYARAQQDG